MMSDDEQEKLTQLNNSARDRANISESWNKALKEELLKEFDGMKIKLDAARDTKSISFENEKSFKLDPNTPVYHGLKTENLERWITLINNNLKAGGVPEERKLYVISNYVKDSALSTLLKYQ